MSYPKKSSLSSFCELVATPQATPQARLTELEAKILKELKSNPRISRAELASTLEIRPDTVQEYIQKLKKKKLLERKGKTSAGRWEVKQQKKQRRRFEQESKRLPKQQKQWLH